MTDNYVPEMSEYIIGMVNKIDDNGSIIIHVLAGAEEIKEPTGKFSMDEYNSEEGGGDGDCGAHKHITEQFVTLQQSELLDAKYVQHEI